MNNKDFAGGVLVGIGVGLGLGILLAPRSGQQTRSLLTKKAKRVAHTVKAQTDDVLETASGVLDDGRTLLAQQKERLEDAIALGKKAYEAVAG